MRLYMKRERMTKGLKMRVKTVKNMRKTLNFMTVLMSKVKMNNACWRMMIKHLTTMLTTMLQILIQLQMKERNQMIWL